MADQKKLNPTESFHDWFEQTYGKTWASLNWLQRGFNKKAPSQNDPYWKYWYNNVYTPAHAKKGKQTGEYPLEGDEKARYQEANAAYQILEAYWKNQVSMGLPVEIAQRELDEAYESLNKQFQRPRTQEEQLALYLENNPTVAQAELNMETPAQLQKRLKEFLDKEFKPIKATEVANFGKAADFYMKTRQQTGIPQLPMSPADQIAALQEQLGQQVNQGAITEAEAEEQLYAEVRRLEEQDWLKGEGGQDVERLRQEEESRRTYLRDLGRTVEAGRTVSLVNEPRTPALEPEVPEIPSVDKIYEDFLGQTSSPALRRFYETQTASVLGQFEQKYPGAREAWWQALNAPAQDSAETIDEKINQAQRQLSRMEAYLTSPIDNPQTYEDKIFNERVNIAWATQRTVDQLESERTQIRQEAESAGVPFEQPSLGVPESAPNVSAFGEGGERLFFGDTGAPMSTITYGRESAPVKEKAKDPWEEFLGKYPAWKTFISTPREWRPGGTTRSRLTPRTRYYG